MQNVRVLTRFAVGMLACGAIAAVSEATRASLIDAGTAEDAPADLTPDWIEPEPEPAPEPQADASALSNEGPGDQSDAETKVEAPAEAAAPVAAGKVVEDQPPAEAAAAGKAK